MNIIEILDSLIDTTQKEPELSNSILRSLVMNNLHQIKSYLQSPELVERVSDVICHEAKVSRDWVGAAKATIKTILGRSVMSETKFCKNCRFHRVKHYEDKCFALNEIEYSLIKGEPRDTYVINCTYERSTGGSCGKEGSLFQPRLSLWQKLKNRIGRL